MAKEILFVPEKHLADFIRVVRAGLEQVKVPPGMKEGLEEWCCEREEYIAYLSKVVKDDEDDDA
jgi:hypothetical protein